TPPAIECGAASQPLRWPPWTLWPSPGATAMTRSADLHTSTDPLRLVEAALLGLLFLAPVAVLSPPAARTAIPQLGRVSLWLLGLPAAALAMDRWLAWSRLRTVDTAAPAAMAPARRRRASVVPARRRAAPRRQARPLAVGLSR